MVIRDCENNTAESIRLYGSREQNRNIIERDEESGEEASRILFSF